MVLGLDPDPGALWPLDEATVGERADSQRAAVGAGTSSDAGEMAGSAVLAHCRALIDAAAEACVAVKPQLARFEALGPVGGNVLRAVADHARGHGLLVIADGKRGDIDVTAKAYASALFGGLQTPFGPIEGLGADLATVNPLMGRDAVMPFVATARDCGAGVLLLVRTSNPGAADVEDLELACGDTVWERVAAIVQEIGVQGVGTSGLSDVGAVLGATQPGHLARARELMPHAPFLLPGIGAQGGRVEMLAPSFLPGPAGGLVSASRSIAEAYRSNGGEPAQAAREEAERLRRQAWALSGQGA